MQNLNRISLSGLRAIEVVARLGTLGAGARELGISTSAMSQRLQSAELALGQIMFVRTVKGMEPTPICLEIAPKLTHAMSELSGVVQRMDPAHDMCLTVSVAPIFASRWLVWRIQRFNALHPEIKLRIDPNLGLVTPDQSDVDLCIRVGRGPWPDVYAEKLLEQRVFPVCAPQVGQDIKSIEDLKHVPIIRENEALYGWDVWLKGQNLEPQSLSAGPTYQDSSLCLDAAMAGQGVFMAWETLACDALEMGRVVAPFPERRETEASYWLISGENSVNKQKVRAFRDWLKAEMANSVKVWRNKV